jgi:hypothetical protein
MTATPPVSATKRELEPLGQTVIATVSKARICLTDTYGIDITPGQDDLLILACGLALNLAEDEEQRDERSCPQS